MHLINPSITLRLMLIAFLAVFLLFTESLSSTSTVPPTQRPYVINGVRYYPINTSSGYVETGKASWYGPGFHGKRTSNGELYDMNGPTAAHKTLPMNTILLVKNLENNKEAIVRVNDRGPFVRGRIIDLSYTTAKYLNVLRKGTAKVRITALAPSLNGKIQAGVDFDRGEFYVQIGSFKIKNNALRLQKRFVDSGHPTVIIEYSTRNDLFYRVQVYAGNSLHHAKRSENALLERGYSGAFIIAR